MENNIRIKIEKAIVTLLVKKLGEAGYVPVTVWDDCEYVPQNVGPRAANAGKLVPRVLTVEEVIDNVFAVDVSTLHFAPADDLDAWGSLGVLLAGGNGEDIISDYHSYDEGSPRHGFCKAIDAVYEVINEGTLGFQE